MLESIRRTGAGEVVGRPLEGAVGDRKRPTDGRIATGPNPELVERPRRRTFTAKYKLKVLGEADVCTKPGEIGALLRREGLYSSHLTMWRREREAGALAALGRRRGRKARLTPEQRRIAVLEAKNARLERELEQARAIIGVQKKLCTLLGLPTAEPSEDSGSES